MSGTYRRLFLSGLPLAFSWLIMSAPLSAIGVEDCVTRVELLLQAGEERGEANVSRALERKELDPRCKFAMAHLYLKRWLNPSATQDQKRQARQSAAEWAREAWEDRPDDPLDDTYPEVLRYALLLNPKEMEEENRFERGREWLRTNRNDKLVELMQDVETVWLLPLKAFVDNPFRSPRPDTEGVWAQASDLADEVDKISSHSERWRTLCQAQQSEANSEGIAEALRKLRGLGVDIEGYSGNHAELLQYYRTFRKARAASYPDDELALHKKALEYLGDARGLVGDVCSVEVRDTERVDLWIERAEIGREIHAAFRQGTETAISQAAGWARRIADLPVSSGLPEKPESMRPPERYVAEVDLLSRYAGYVQGVEINFTTADPWNEFHLADSWSVSSKPHERQLNALRAGVKTRYCQLTGGELDRAENSLTAEEPAGSTAISRNALRFVETCGLNERQARIERLRRLDQNLVNFLEAALGQQPLPTLPGVTKSAPQRYRNSYHLAWRYPRHEPRRGYYDGMVLIHQFAEGGGWAAQLRRRSSFENLRDQSRSRVSSYLTNLGAGLTAMLREKAVANLKQYRQDFDDPDELRGVSLPTTTTTTTTTSTTTTSTRPPTTTTTSIAPKPPTTTTISRTPTTSTTSTISSTSTTSTTSTPVSTTSTTMPPREAPRTRNFFEVKAAFRKMSYFKHAECIYEAKWRQRDSCIIQGPRAIARAVGECAIKIKKGRSISAMEQGLEVIEDQCSGSNEECQQARLACYGIAFFELIGMQPEEARVIEAKAREGVQDDRLIGLVDDLAGLLSEPQKPQ